MAKEIDPNPYYSPLYGRTNWGELSRPGNATRARMVATYEFKPRELPECGEWGHDDNWIVDEREPMIWYCPDCNTEFGDYFA